MNKLLIDFKYDVDYNFPSLKAGESVQGTAELKGQLEFVVEPSGNKVRVRVLDPSTLFSGSPLYAPESMGFVHRTVKPYWEAGERLVLECSGDLAQVEIDMLYEPKGRGHLTIFLPYSGDGRRRISYRIKMSSRDFQRLMALA